MGTQRAAVSAGRVRYGRFHSLKGVAFWGFLFAASFVFGMLIVSPLLTAAGVGEQKENPSTSQAPNSQSPAPQTAPVAAAVVTPKTEDKKPTKAVAPDIEL